MAGDNTSHRHIRVVPRADNEPGRPYGSDLDSLTPVFRSPPLPCPAPTMSKRTPASQDLQAESFAQARSFADMVRRTGINIAEDDSESVAHTPASMAGIIKLQPNRTRENNAWRPARDSDVGNLSTNGRGGNKNFSAAEDMNRFQPHSTAATLSFLAPTHYPPVQGCGIGRSVASPTSGQRTNSEDASKHSLGYNNGVATVKPAINDWNTGLFGKLPDPIHLHEQLGEFDGQVLFIGHPNRDVSKAAFTNYVRDIY